MTIKNRGLAHWMWAVVRKCGLGPLALRWHPRSGLRQLGWYSSFRHSRPTDASGACLPWWSYPGIEFLEQRLTKGLRVVEFGSGYSTLWLSERVGNVVSFEADRGWAARIARLLPSNASVIPIDSFEQALSEPPSGLGLFDLAVVDCDADRIRCAQFAVDNLLGERGVVLWDDTEGSDESIRTMAPRGFREISFSGMSPQVLHLKKTTIFYRAGSNCLDI